MKAFNTTAVCIPSKHYMVDITERVNEIKKYVDEGKYFTINRARQYGKTTTLNALKKVIQYDYVVLSLSFEQISDSAYRTEGEFIQAFSRIVLDQNLFSGLEIPEQVKSEFNRLNSEDVEKPKLDELYRTFRRWITMLDRPMVLIIDEVDTATNNQVFIDFLAVLRDGYIARDTDGLPAFQSVILAGVTDVKHLKGKIRADGESKQNSPWNIAADFNIDMSLSEEGIARMLEEYDLDHDTKMDVPFVAKQIREYTNGYPFLVSRICQLIDTEIYARRGDLRLCWTKTGIEEAVKLLLAETNTLFKSLTTKLHNYPELCQSLRNILMEGQKLTYNSLQDSIVQMEMYGFIRNENNTVKIANRIFETVLYNYFLSGEELKSNSFSKEGSIAKSLFVKDGKLDMPLILGHFIETYNDIFGPLKEKFKEKDGRELFLLYIKPIINGTGNYYIEAQTRNQTRTDLIIDYLGQQYVIEMKIWRGPRYNADGEKQISEYLDYFHLGVGYMISFNFNDKKKTGVDEVHFGDKVLYEAVV